MTVDELCEIVHGPDFPTGGTIFRFEDQRNSLSGEKERIDVIRHMYATGRGRVVIRGQVSFEEDARGRISVVITELPYQVNKTTLIEKMAELVGGKRITDVSDIRDESDRTGMRIVVEVKRDGSPHTVMQQLFKHTALQTSFSANMLALVDGQPQTLGLKRMLEHYITYRREVIRRRTQFDLARAQERAHILEGLKIALDNLDEVIKTIRASADADAARAALVEPLQAERGAGQRDPGDAAAPPGRPRAQEDRGRVRAGDPPHRRARGPARQPAQDPDRDPGRARGAGPQVRGRPQDADPVRCQPRADRRGPGRRRGRRRDALAARLHQAPADRHLPLPAARRQGQAGDDHARGGRGAPPARGEHARQHPLLHQPRPRLHHEGAHAARRRAARRRGCRSSTCPG